MIRLDVVHEFIDPCIEPAATCLGGRTVRIPEHSAWRVGSDTICLEFAQRWSWACGHGVDVDEVGCEVQDDRGFDVAGMKVTFCCLWPPRRHGTTFGFEDSAG